MCVKIMYGFITGCDEKVKTIIGGVEMPNKWCVCKHKPFT